MSYSTVSYLGNGSTTNYTLPFGYISRSDISVMVAGIPRSFTWISNSIVQVSPAPELGTPVYIKRTTQKATVPVNFTDGSTLLESDLDALALYVLYVAQEQEDRGVGSGGESGSAEAAAAAAIAAAADAAAAAAAAEAAVEAIGEGSGVPPLGGTTLADYTFYNGGPVSTFYPDTVPRGWNTDVGRCTISLEFKSNGYFTANPTAHFAIVGRCNTDVIATQIHGTGAWLGNLVGYTNGNDYKPSVGIETWFNGLDEAGRDNYLFRYSGSGRSATLVEGQQYRIVLDSSKNSNGLRYTRYTLYAYEAPGEYWRLVHDTGDVLDPNRWADLTKHGLCLLHVFNTDNSPWTLEFTNIKVTWGDAGPVVSDTSANVSRFGADVDGDLRLLGDSRRFLVNNSGSLINKWSSFQSQEANTSTVVMAMPNGTNTAATFFSINSSTPNISFAGVGMGMNGATAILETFNLGQTNPQYGINIGSGNRVATFKTTGLNILGATKDIGASWGTFNNVTNIGGIKQSAMTAGSTLDFEGLCTTNVIRSYIAGSPSVQQGVEELLLPLYAFFGMLVKELRNKKVI